MITTDPNCGQWVAAKPSCFIRWDDDTKQTSKDAGEILIAMRDSVA